MLYRGCQSEPPGEGITVSRIAGRETASVMRTKARFAHCAFAAAALSKRRTPKVSSIMAAGAKLDVGPRMTTVPTTTFQILDDSEIGKIAPSSPKQKTYKTIL